MILQTKDGLDTAYCQ